MFKEAVYGPMNDKQVNMAERIMKNTQRLLGLINDLLDQAVEAQTHHPNGADPTRRITGDPA